MRTVNFNFENRIFAYRRLRGRGDADQKVEKRLRKAEEEEPVGKAIADYVIINDDLESTLEEMSRIIAYERKQRTPS